MKRRKKKMKKKRDGEEEKKTKSELAREIVTTRKLTFNLSYFGHLTLILN